MEEVIIIKAYLLENRVPAGLDRRQRRNFVLKAARFVLENGELFGVDGGRRYKVVADDDTAAIKAVLNELHLPGHLGCKCLYMEVNNRYVGFLRQRIDEYVKNCEACQRHQPLKRTEPITPIVANRRWERVIVDYIDLRLYADLNDGYKWILNLIDSYSRYKYLSTILRILGK